MEFNSILNGKEQTGADCNDIIHLERIKKLKLSLTLWDVRLPILSPSFVPSTTSTVPTTVTQFQAMVRKTMVRKTVGEVVALTIPHLMSTIEGIQPGSGSAAALPVSPPLHHSTRIGRYIP